MRAQPDQGKRTQAERYVAENAGGAFNPSYTQFAIQLEEVKADMEALKLQRAEYQKESQGV